MIILIKSHNSRDFNMRIEDHKAKGHSILKHGRTVVIDRTEPTYWAKIDIGGTAIDE